MLLKFLPAIKPILKYSDVEQNISGVKILGLVRFSVCYRFTVGCGIVKNWVLANPTFLDFQQISGSTDTQTGLIDFLIIFPVDS